MQSELHNRLITQTLPNIPDNTVDAVIKLLKDLGVDSTRDLPLVLESDLVPLLKPIHARRLIAAWSCKY